MKPHLDELCHTPVGKRIHTRLAKIEADESAASSGVSTANTSNGSPSGSSFTAVSSPDRRTKVFPGFSQLPPPQKATETPTEPVVANHSGGTDDTLRPASQPKTRSDPKSEPINDEKALEELLR